MSYDVYVNLRYDDASIRALVDRAERVDFFSDGETAAFSAAQFAAHNDRFRGSPAHAYLGASGAAGGGGAGNDADTPTHAHGFTLIINRTGRSAALHDAGYGDFDHARETIRDLVAWLRASVPGARVERASVTSSQGYADYVYVGALGGWQITDTGDGRTRANAAL